MSRLNILSRIGFSGLERFNRVRTRPTKEGITFLGISLFVGFAALNTGNNLIYLTFGMMLSFIALSGMISMVNLRSIDLQYDTPTNVFALTPIYFKVHLTNRKMLVSSYSISVQMEGERVFISYLPVGVTRTVKVRCFFSHRGWNKIPDIYIATSFPFGFFRKRVKIKAVDSPVLVYPKVDRIKIDESEHRRRYGETHAEKSGFGSDIRSIRQYQAGDNPKFIHWKSSAKVGDLMIRELQEEESPGAVIKFNPESDKTKLEIQISRIASLVLELTKNDYDLEFIAPDKTFTSSQIGKSPKPVLRYLALYGT